MREVLAQNVNRMMEQRYRESSNRPMALAKDAGVSLSTVQRTLSREAGASIDTVESFAKVFGLSAYQMLVPWGLLGEISASQQGSAGAKKRQPLFSGRDRVDRSRRTPAAKRIR